MRKVKIKDSIKGEIELAYISKDLRDLDRYLRRKTCSEGNFMLYSEISGSDTICQIV